MDTQQTQRTQLTLVYEPVGKHYVAVDGDVVYSVDAELFMYRVGQLAQRGSDGMRMLSTYKAAMARVSRLDFWIGGDV